MMNTVSSLVLRCFDAPRGADRSLLAVALLSCVGLLVSLGLMSFGFDLGIGWV
jgi:hypothetical protein